jgi:hypothetical protein
MFVLYNALLWSLPFVGAPCALVLALLGPLGLLGLLGPLGLLGHTSAHAAFALALLVVFYVALGARVARMTQPPPLGAEPADVPHLTLFHPHGIVTTGFSVALIGDRVWNARRRNEFGAPHFLAAAIWPFMDIWARCCFACRISSASRASVVSLMRANKDLYLYPGGFVEAARHSYHADVVDVGSRGAIRLALRHGYAVRVGFAFGERETAYNLQAVEGPRALWRFRLWLARRGVPAVLPLLRVWARAPRIAFSPTIQLPLVRDPTRDDVERWHAEYVAALRALHARYKRPGDVLVVHGA